MRRHDGLLNFAVAACLTISACSSDAPGSGVATDRVPGTDDAAPAATPVVATTPPLAVASSTVAPSTAAVVTTITQPPSADTIAAVITEAERGIRDTSLTPEAVAAFGRRQQRAYQLLARNPDLQEAVAAEIPADVAVAFAFNVAARRAVVDHAATGPAVAPSATLPAWTILPPRPIDELMADYRAAEAATGVPWEYLAAINLVETRMGRISGSSSAGAQGPMQFLPQTWAACCTGNIDDPRDAIVGAATYLAQSGAPADMHAALAAYNPNEGYVGAVTAYAANLMADPLAYRGYHAWEVYVSSVAGTVRLPVGYRESAPVDAIDYVRAHPDDQG